MSEENRETTRSVGGEPPSFATPDESAGSHASSTATGPTSGPGPNAIASSETIKDAVISVLKTVYDPEIPVDIYELGLIYRLEVDPGGAVSIHMTLTTPMCPVAEILPPEVEAKARAVEGVTSVDLQLVWDPPWSVERMSETARLDLNL